MLRTILAVLLAAGLPSLAKADDAPKRVIDTARLIIPDDPELGFNAAAGAIDVDRLRVSTINGGVRILFNDDLETATVRASVHSDSAERAQDAALRLVHNENTAELFIEVDWPGREEDDSADIEIVMPAVDALDVTTGNGSVSVTNGSGEANITTGNGGVAVVGFEGAASVSTRNGGIRIAGDLAAVSAESRNGGISIELGEGATGPVTASTRNGGLSLVVNDAFQGLVDIETRNGGINTFRAGADSYQQTGDRAYTFVYGDSDERSSLTTRNGGIAIVKAQKKADESI